MKRTGMILSAIAVSALLISSCRKEPLNDMTGEESRIYVTNYNDTADFTSYKTFSIVDSVAVISNRDDAKKELTEYDAKLLNSLKTSLQGRGYTLVDKATKPDLALNVSRIDNTTTSIGYNPGYWTGFPGYWDPGYWGYPGYGYWFPNYYSVFRYREKSVVVDLLDLKNAPKANDKLNAIWNAMLRGSGVWNSDNIESMVKAVIDQSAYLKASNN